MPAAWGHVTTDNSLFPIHKGENISVKCEEKYVNLGNEIVTCNQGANYKGSPNCQKPSKELLIKLLLISLIL